MLLSSDYIYSHWNRASIHLLRHILYVPSAAAFKKSYGLVYSSFAKSNETTNRHPSELEQFIFLFSFFSLLSVFLWRIETEIRSSNLIFVFFFSRTDNEGHQALIGGMEWKQKLANRARCSLANAKKETKMRYRHIDYAF